MRESADTVLQNSVREQWGRGGGRRLPKTQRKRLSLRNIPKSPPVPTSSVSGIQLEAGPREKWRLDRKRDFLDAAGGRGGPRFSSQWSRGPPLLGVGMEVQGRGRWGGLSSWIISHGSQALGEGPLD